MALKGEDALSGADIPNFGSVVKGRGHQFVPISVEIEAHDFGPVTSEVEDFLASLDVPYFCGLVHRAGCHKHAVRVER